MDLAGPLALLPSFLCIDSHVHLYTESQIPRLAWSDSLPPDHILKQQHSVSEYRDAVRHPAVALEPLSLPKIILQGFIHLETDRVSRITPENGGWADVLEEVTFVSRIAKGCPDIGEDSDPHERSLVLGIIPWAPISAGSNVLDGYLDRVRNACGDCSNDEESDRTFRLIKGFRYLVQDKLSGTMLQPQFIQGLQWLREKGYVFELGVDARSGGTWQLEEAYQMLLKVCDKKFTGLHVAERKVLTVVINHFCKPNLRIRPQECCDGGDAEFLAWRDGIAKLANIEGTFMKLSGVLTELPGQKELTFPTISDVLATVRPWVEVVFTAFGPQRVMFGSDWPVCTANGSADKAWTFWVEIVSCILEDFGLSSEQKSQVWAETARKAYGIVPSKQYFDRALIPVRLRHHRQE